MSIRWEQIQNLLVSNSEINLLAGLTATAAELNVLSGYTGTAADLNDVVGLATNFQTHINEDFSTAHPIAPNSLDGGLLVDGTVTQAKLNFPLVLQADLDSLEVLHNNLRIDHDNLQSQVDTLATIVIPGAGEDILDAINQTIAHISDIEDAHDASSISYGEVESGYYYLPNDVLDTATQVVLNASLIRYFRDGGSIRFQSNVASVFETTITGVDYDTFVVTFTDPVPEDFLVADQARIWSLDEANVQQAVTRSLRNNTDIFTGRLTLTDSDDLNLLVFDNSGAGSDIHFNAQALITSGAGFNFKFAAGAQQLNVLDSADISRFGVDSDGDVHSNTLTLKDFGSGFDGLLTKEPLTADRTWTMPDSDGTFALAEQLGKEQVLYIDKSRADAYIETGAPDKPFKTIEAAYTAVTDASSVKRYAFIIEPGAYTESPTFILKPWITLLGRDKELVTISKSDLSPVTWTATGSGRIAMEGVTFNNGLTVTRPAASPGGAVLNVNEIQVNGDLTFNGLGGGVDYLFLRESLVTGDLIGNSVATTVINSFVYGEGNFSDTGNEHNDAYGFAAIVSMNSSYINNIVTTSVNRPIYLQMFACKTETTILIDDQGSVIAPTLSTDAVSLPYDEANLTLTGNAVLDLTTIASNIKYTPATLSDWEGAGPTNVKLALDELAALSRYFSQFQILPHETDSDKVRISGSDITLLDGRILSQEAQGLLTNSDGAVINFTTGQVFKSDGVTPLGVDFAPFALPVGEYAWYGLGLVSGVLNPDNTVSVQLTITVPTTSDADDLLALKPAEIPGDKKLGAIEVFNNAGSIEVFKIRQLGVGSGSGGSGTGDASKTENIIDAWHLDSPFKYVAKNIISTEGEELVDTVNTTATLGGSQYDFLAGEVLQSLNHLDATEIPEAQKFLDALEDIPSVQILVVMPDGAEEDDGVLEVTRDGNEYQQAALVKEAGGTKHFELVFEEEVAASSLVEYDLVNNDASLVLNATTILSRSQEFLASTSTSVYTELQMQLNKTGTPSGFYRIKIVDDNVGSPGDEVYDSGYYAVSGLAAGVNLVTLDIPNVLLIPGDKYHIVVETDADYKDSFSAGVHQISVRADSSAPAIPVSQFYNGTIWAAQAGSAIAHILSGRVHDLRFRYTASNNDVAILGYGIIFGQVSVFLTNIGSENYFKMYINGDDNVTDISFDASFVPDPVFFKILINNTGQTFMHGEGFTLDPQSNTVYFADGALEVPGQTLELIFTQHEGATVDNSYSNAADLSELHAGRFKTPGRGLATMKPDTSVREITLDDDDNIVIKDQTGAITKEHIEYTQRFNLTSDVNTSTTITEWDIDNLIVGMGYEIAVHVYFRFIVDGTATLKVQHDGETKGQITATAGSGIRSMVIKFIATTTTVSFTTSSLTADRFIDATIGPGNEQVSWMEITEKPNMKATTKFNP